MRVWQGSAGGRKKRGACYTRTAGASVWRAQILDAPAQSTLQNPGFLDLHYIMQYPLQYRLSLVRMGFMKIDEADMISATDISRNTGRYVTQAAAGRRFVIMNNHQPVVALIGMADLRRLDELDNAATTTTTPTGALPQEVSLENITPFLGRIPLGVTATGATVNLDLLEHLLVVGKGASDTIGTLLWGVATDGLDARFVIATERTALTAGPGRAALISSMTTGLDGQSAARLVEQGRVRDAV